MPFAYQEPVSHHDGVLAGHGRRDGRDEGGEHVGQSPRILAHLRRHLGEDAARHTHTGKVRDVQQHVIGDQSASAVL